MNEKIKQHLIDYCNKEGYDSSSDEDLWETLTECGSELFRSDVDVHRWWNEFFVVKSINGMIIGFYDAETTGDESAVDKGWNYDLSSVCEVVAQEKTITVYKPKEENEN